MTSGGTKTLYAGNSLPSDTGGPSGSIEWVDGRGPGMGGSTHISALTGPHSVLSGPDPERRGGEGRRGRGVARVKGTFTDGKTKSETVSHTF